MSNVQLELYRQGLLREKETEQRQREERSKQRDAQQMQRMISWLEIEPNKSKRFRPFTSYDMTPILKVHGVPAKSNNTGNVYTKKVLCMAQYNRPCQYCDLQDRWKELSEAERKTINPYKVLTLFGLDYSLVGQTSSYTNAKTGTVETVPVSPIRHFQRSPGTADANFFELESMEVNAELPLNLMDISISRLSSVTDSGMKKTDYRLQSMDKGKGKELVVPTGIDPAHLKIINEIMKANEQGNVFYTLDLAAKTFQLPEGVTSYPPSSELAHFTQTGMTGFDDMFPTDEEDEDLPPL